MFFEIDYILFFKEVVFVFFNYVISVYLKLIDFLLYYNFMVVN